MRLRFFAQNVRAKIFSVKKRQKETMTNGENDRESREGKHDTIFKTSNSFI